MITGYIYGVVLNDNQERTALGETLSNDPYKAPPKAPVVYIKPRMTVTTGGAPVPVPAGEDEVVLSSTIGVIFSRSVAPNEDNPLSAVSAWCLALDVSLPEKDYYRPAIRQRCRDGFLPLGAPVAMIGGAELENRTITTRLDGEVVHQWSLDRLVRPVGRLVADLASFMTFEAGDMLLIGLPGDAPRAGPGTVVSVEAEGLPTLVTRLEVELQA